MYCGQNTSYRIHKWQKGLMELYPQNRKSLINGDISTGRMSISVNLVLVTVVYMIQLSGKFT